MTKRQQAFWLRIALAVGSLALAGWFSWKSYVLVSRGKRARATCTRIERTTTGDSRRTSWYVTYETEQGVQSGVDIDASFTGLAEGDEIDVLYDPQDPRRAQAANFVGLWGMPAIFGVIAVFFLAGELRRRLRLPRE